MQVFNTLKEAENYYWGNLAKHNEDEAGLERWLENVIIPARILGSLRSKKKAKSSRANGKKGGRPKKLAPTDY